MIKYRENPTPGARHLTRLLIVAQIIPINRCRVIPRVRVEGAGPQGLEPGRDGYREPTFSGRDYADCSVNRGESAHLLEAAEHEREGEVLGRVVSWFLLRPPHFTSIFDGIVPGLLETVILLLGLTWACEPECRVL